MVVGLGGDLTERKFSLCPDPREEQIQICWLEIFLDFGCYTPEKLPPTLSCRKKEPTPDPP